MSEVLDFETQEDREIRDYLSGLIQEIEDSGDCLFNVFRINQSNLWGCKYKKNDAWVVFELDDIGVVSFESTDEACGILFCEFAPNMILTFVSLDEFNFIIRLELAQGGRLQ